LAYTNIFKYKRKERKRVKRKKRKSSLEKQNI